MNIFGVKKRDYTIAVYLEHDPFVVSGDVNHQQQQQQQPLLQAQDHNHNQQQQKRGSNHYGATSGNGGGRQWRQRWLHVVLVAGTMLLVGAAVLHFLLFLVTGGEVLSSRLGQLRLTSPLEYAHRSSSPSSEKKNLSMPVENLSSSSVKNLSPSLTMASAANNSVPAPVSNKTAATKTASKITTNGAVEPSLIRAPPAIVRGAPHSHDSSSSLPRESSSSSPISTVFLDCHRLVGAGREPDYVAWARTNRLTRPKTEDHPRAMDCPAIRARHPSLSLLLANSTAVDDHMRLGKVGDQDEWTEEFPLAYIHNVYTVCQKINI